MSGVYQCDGCGTRTAVHGGSPLPVCRCPSGRLEAGRPDRNGCDYAFEWGRLIAEMEAGGNGGADFATEDAGTPMQLFHEAGLLSLHCDAAVASIGMVLRNLARVLRSGGTIGPIPVDPPEPA